MHLIRLKDGELLALRLWRIVIYLDKTTFPSLRYGGIVVDYKGKRVSATHIMGRISFITDSHISMSGLAL
jgi:hypothetical protein